MDFPNKPNNLTQPPIHIGRPWEKWFLWFFLFPNWSKRKKNRSLYCFANSHAKCHGLSYNNEWDTKQKINYSLWQESWLMALNSGEGKNKTEIWDNTRVTHAAMRLTAALEQVIHIIILSFSHHFIAVRLSSCFFFFFLGKCSFPTCGGHVSMLISNVAVGKSFSYVRQRDCYSFLENSKDFPWNGYGFITQYASAVHRL